MGVEIELLDGETVGWQDLQGEKEARTYCYELEPSGVLVVYETVHAIENGHLTTSNDSTAMAYGAAAWKRVRGKRFISRS